MPYTHTSLNDLKDRLSLRLGDSGKVFFTDTELGVYATEALRMWGGLTGYWRDRGTLSTTSGTTFYDLGTLLDNGPDLILSRTVTDRNVIQSMQYHLLEDSSSQSAWAGTDMFTLNDLRYAIQRRRDQFLFDTGIVLTRSTMNMPAPPISRVPVSESIIDVRRVRWVGVGGTSYVLWRDDEFNLTAYDSSWAANPGNPNPLVYSVAATRPIEIQVGPPPNDSATLELITVNSGTALDPASSATALGIPDNWVWVVKWGALAELLSSPGQAYDPFRASLCEQLYQLGVQAAKGMPVVIAAQIQGLNVQPCALFDIDAYSGISWQDTTGTPTQLGNAGNLVAASNTPDGVYSITLDVVRNAPVPTASAIQIGKEHLSAVLDMAQYLAAFKQGGEDITAVQHLFNSFMEEAQSFSAHLRAAIRNSSVMSSLSSREESYRPREVMA